MTKNIYGWLSPKGNFYETDFFHHIQDIGKYPELKNMIPNYDEKIISLIQIHRDSEDLIEQGEHPEWHCYEMAADDFLNDVKTRLYDCGCLRVGSKDKTMYFEGLPKSIKNLHEKAKDLAESCEKTAKFEPKK